MNTKLILPLILSLSGAAILHAGKSDAGPKGGRLLESEPLRAEFYVNSDRKVEIAFYDEALQVVAPHNQVVNVTAELGTGRALVALEKTPSGLVSTDPLPAGEPYRVVVQVRATPDSRPQNFRVDLVLDVCGECNRAEYACICEGH